MLTLSTFIITLPLQPVGKAAFSSMILFQGILIMQTISSGFSLDVCLDTSVMLSESPTHSPGV